MNKKVNNKLDFHARIDKGWKDILLQLKTSEKTSLKSLIEDALGNTYMIGKDGKPRRINQ